MARISQRPPEDQQAPISWMQDSATVTRVIRYCVIESDRLRGKPMDLYTEARLAILERIYGNVLHSNSIAYPSEISFETVAGGFTRYCGDSPDEQSKRKRFIIALVSEWDQLRSYFDKELTRRNPEY